MRYAALALSLGLTVLVSGCGGSDAKPSPQTIVSQWSPFDAPGHVKRTLRVVSLGRGRCIPGPSSETIGDAGFRCSAGNGLGDPCWRDGPRATHLVACVYSPWDHRVETIRVRRLTLRAGTTLTASDPVRDPPWAIELTTGDRCVLLQGAHDVVKQGSRSIPVDYLCRSSGILLLRTLRRGRTWRIGAVKLTNGRFRALGDLVVKRAIFGAP